jgi:ribonuclease D
VIKYTLITTNDEFISFMNSLADNCINSIAIDFEAEYNLHVYGEKLCLIQIFDNKNYYIVDPYKINRDLLASFFENSKITKYGYGSESDKSTLYKQYQIQINSLFDIKYLVDILAFEKKSLDSVIKSLFNVTIPHKKAFQRFNWTRRPLPKDALEYALCDVQYLFSIKDQLLKKIEKKGGDINSAIKAMQREFDYKKVSIPGIKRDYRYLELSKNQKNLFDKLLMFREEIAKNLNLPPDQVIQKEFMYKSVSHEFDCSKIAFTQKIPNTTRNNIIEFIRNLNA